jgi:hypothetical protein
MKELWRGITGWENYYVSNLGEVKSSKHDKNGRTRKQHKSSFGYLSVILKNKPKVKGYLVHRLVAQEFIPNPQNKRCVNHINGIKTDNRAINLEWVTHKENVKHAVYYGLSIFKGEDNPNAILNKKDVLFIRNSDLSNIKLSEMFKVSPPTISSVKHNRNWN